MSQSDIQRFIQDLKTNPELQEAIKGQSGGLEAVVAFATSQGYDISLDEAKAYIRAQSQQELTDEQLDAIAGGKGGHHPGSNTSTNVSTVTVEAAHVATTAEVAAEVVVVAVVT